MVGLDPCGWSQGEDFLPYRAWWCRHLFGKEDHPAPWHPPFPITNWRRRINFPIGLFAPSSWNYMKTACNLYSVWSPRRESWSKRQPHACWQCGLNSHLLLEFKKNVKAARRRRYNELGLCWDYWTKTHHATSLKSICQEVWSEWNVVLRQSCCG